MPSLFRNGRAFLLLLLVSGCSLEGMSCRVSAVVHGHMRTLASAKAVYEKCVPFVADERPWAIAALASVLPTLGPAHSQAEDELLELARMKLIHRHSLTVILSLQKQESIRYLRLPRKLANQLMAGDGFSNSPALRTVFNDAARLLPQDARLIFDEEVLDWVFTIPGRGVFSPLSLAVQKRNLPLVRFLLKQGADPNLGFHGDRAGRFFTPLGMAIRMKKRKIAEALINAGADQSAVYYHSKQNQAKSAAEIMPQQWKRKNKPRKRSR